LGISWDRGNPSGISLHSKDTPALLALRGELWRREEFSLTFSYLGVILMIAKVQPEVFPSVI